MKVHQLYSSKLFVAFSFPALTNQGAAHIMGCVGWFLLLLLRIAFEVIHFVCVNLR